MEKIFILFGSSGDLGRTAVNYFLNEDYDYYYFISRKPFRVEAQKNNFEIILADDLSLESNVEDVFSKIPKKSSGKYFLFNTIGGFAGGSKIRETDFKIFENMIKINLIPSFLIAKHFSRLLINTLGGSICFTSAESSFNNEVGKSAYGISKNGINYLIKTLALEGKEIGMTANGVAPYAIDSKANREWITDSQKLIPAEKVLKVVNGFFENHPQINGEILRL